jgi:hypothetical protein
MEKKEKSECPYCKKKLPFSYVIKIKNDHSFECPNCCEIISPETTKSFTSGYILGFLGFIIPAKVLLYFYDGFFFAFLGGLMSGITVIFLISLYVYYNTILTK